MAIETWLVCGSRDWGRDEYDTVAGALDALCERRGKTTDRSDPDDNWMPTEVRIITGNDPKRPRGVDCLAIDWAISRWLDFKEFPADWTRYGPSAGPIRNQQMLDEGKPTLVVAFPGGRGTADMSRRALQAGIELIEVRADGSF